MINNEDIELFEVASYDFETIIFIQRIEQLISKLTNNLGFSRAM